MRTVGPIVALAVLIGLGPPVAVADEAPLVGPVLNLDTPAVPESGKLASSGALRLFGSKQDGVFADLRLDYGLGTGLAATLRGTAGPRRVYDGGSFIIRHGGNDAELLLRYMPPGTARCAAEIGVSYADTPAQKDVFPTVQLLHERELSPGLSLTLAPRAVFI